MNIHQDFEFDQKNKLRIEVSADIIIQMMETGILSASDMRCLDCSSKKYIWNMCLKICAERMAERMNETKYKSFANGLRAIPDEKDRKLLRLMLNNIE